SENMGATTKSITLSVYPPKFILFDQGHGQYYDAVKCEQFIDYLEAHWASVYINNDTIDSEEVASSSVIIITNLAYNLTNDEYSLLKNFVENGGNLLLAGDGNWGTSHYFHPEYYNLLTENYGITWLDGEIYDPEVNWDSDYKPKLMTFGTDAISRLLTMDLSYVYFPGGTFLNVTGDATAVVMGNEGTTYAENYTDKAHVANGTDAIGVAAVELTGGGKILASGASKVFVNYYSFPYAFANNTQFAENIMRWFLGTSHLTVSQVTTTCPAGVATMISIEVTNDGTSNLIDINVTLTVPTGVSLHSPATHIISELSVGEGQTLSWNITASALEVYEFTVRYKAYDLDEQVYTFNITAQDQTPPEVTITSPEDGATVTAGDIEIQFNATDNFGLEKIIVYVDGVNVTELPANATTVIVHLSAGEHTITVKAIDKAGLEGTDTITVTAKAAGMPPELIYGGVGVAVVIVAVLVYFFYFKKKGG
ncbi:MAG: Ig-like domain-containing protein, partial [Candidatus Njordarchaeum guaymaensis]